jgi:hypothetical protein
MPVNVPDFGDEIILDAWEVNYRLASLKQREKYVADSYKHAEAIRSGQAKALGISSDDDVQIHAAYGILQFCADENARIIAEYKAILGEAQARSNG